MKTLLARLVREEAGQDLIEYGLLLGVITVAVVTTISAIGVKTQSFFQTLCSAIGATGC